MTADDNYCNSLVMNVNSLWVYAAIGSLLMLYLTITVNWEDTAIWATFGLVSAGFWARISTPTWQPSIWPCRHRLAAGLLTGIAGRQLTESRQLSSQSFCGWILLGRMNTFCLLLILNRPLHFRRLCFNRVCLWLDYVKSSEIPRYFMKFLPRDAL